MCLARLRRFAWTLVLTLLAGLAAPALAPASAAAGVAAPVPAVQVHTHADGSVHSHDRTAAADQEQASHPGATRPVKAPHHCPGCLSAAECALACVGSGVLPASVPLPVGPAPRAWAPATVPALAGIVPASDLDPPRPVR